MTKEWKFLELITDKPTFDPITTTDDNWTNTKVTEDDLSYWDTEFLQGKVLKFSAATNNLKVKILGALDSNDGAGVYTFSDTVEAEFAVNVGTPVIKRISNYWTALKVQVKTAGSGLNGTLSTVAVGTSMPDLSDVEVTAIVNPVVSGTVGIDQVTANANEVVVKTSALPSGASTSTLQTDIKDLLTDLNAISNLVQLGSERIVGNSASQAMTMPANTLVIRVDAEGGPVRISHVGAASATTIPRIPEEAIDYIPMKPTDTPYCYAATGTVANICYYGAR